MTKFDHNICIESKDIADCSYITMAEVGFSSVTIEKVKQDVEATKRSLI